ncbi:MAG: glycoside hydrolase family 32 protein, partial [Saprospiraceae bacterium]|nr:glycoside hydrolase family 32 protein [Saprospiraceae bacterium]
MLGKYLLPAALASLCLAACTQKNPPAPATETPANYYTEAHRPQFHFSPEKMWMNDPNGMVYYDGEYHLFYQYYPGATVWGPMHWGHAVSRDLVHWEHLPIALYPDSLGYIFSGSAVVDWNNSSGFGKDGKPPLVAIFTHHNMAAEKAGRIDYQYQSIAYSNDGGRSWTKYTGNPVIPNPGNIRDFRDPKVIWDAASRQWVLVLAAGNHV